ncbi:putative exodeoxyribonuclease [Salmonella virus STSR3]|nr:putative exodeoxyribonuclease [Salmonella virus STSR3]
MYVTTTKESNMSEFKVFTHNQLTNDEYHDPKSWAAEYVSGSSLAEIYFSCPAKWKFKPREETKALVFGTQSHTNFRAKELFEAEYRRATDPDEVKISSQAGQRPRKNLLALVQAGKLIQIKLIVVKITFFGLKSKNAGPEPMAWFQQKITTLAFVECWKEYQNTTLAIAQQHNVSFQFSALSEALRLRSDWITLMLLTMRLTLKLASILMGSQFTNPLRIQKPLSLTTKPRQVLTRKSLHVQLSITVITKWRYSTTCLRLTRDTPCYRSTVAREERALFADRIPHAPIDRSPVHNQSVCGVSDCG